MKNTLICIPIILITLCSFSQKKLSYTNKSYEPHIKTIQLYNYKTTTHNDYQPAISSLSQQPSLRLEFDDLTTDISNYYATIIHCNYKWDPSQLNELNFIATYNEFNIAEYRFSNGTRVPYIHYQFNIPHVKLPGNYVIVVYRNSDKKDIVLSHRFMVYNNLIKISKNNENASLTLRNTDQLLQFTINYKGLDIFNPSGSTHLVIRQNRRWDNAKFDVSTGTIREDIKQLQYCNFNEDKYFKAGNEFRFVDLRSINFPGQNTGKIDRSTTPIHIWVQPEKSRTHQAYAQYPDINGGYYVKNLDYINSPTSSEYLKVTFTLTTPHIPNEKVYVVGSFNQWTQDENSEMKYHNATSSYSYTTLLKQGWYNYSYLLQSDQYPFYYFEGSHFETENQYEVLFYYHSLNVNADLLAGYFSVTENEH